MKNRKVLLTAAIATMGAGAILTAAIAVAKAQTDSTLDELAAHNDNPATDYDAAIARFAQVQAEEGDAINPLCHSKLMTHGNKTERVIVLVHGMTNCPQQFAEFAPLFFEHGYNVLIPRMPRNGLANRMTEELKYLTAEELRDCCNTMVDITRIRSEQFEIKHKENVNIIQLVQHVLEQYIDSKHEINLVTRDDEIIVNSDEGRIEQVLNNLVGNAVKYSPAGKPIEVRVERDKHEVTIAVRDEGVGISEEQQRHIFERFYRVHNDANAAIEGLGLGLYIAHEIVVRHGGRMWLESKPGKGSTFYFSLPLST